MHDIDTIGVYIALVSLDHISLVADFVFMIVLARQKISPVSPEKVWLSLSWWNISLWRVKPDFYWANNRIGYACQHLTVQAMEKPTVKGIIMKYQLVYTGRPFCVSRIGTRVMCAVAFDSWESFCIYTNPVFTFEYILLIHKVIWDKIFG